MPKMLHRQHSGGDVESKLFNLFPDVSHEGVSKDEDAMVRWCAVLWVEGGFEIQNLLSRQN